MPEDHEVTLASIRSELPAAGELLFGVPVVSVRSHASGVIVELGNTQHQQLIFRWRKGRWVCTEEVVSTAQEAG